MNKIVKKCIIGVIVVLYLLTSGISTFHVIDFFALSNPYWLAVTLAIAFEIGAAASLASLIILDKINKNLTWFLFVLLTAIQINGNLYYAFTHMTNFRSWSELFGMIDEEIIFQKRILSIISGAVLPVIALGFIKSLVDYLKSDNKELASPYINLVEKLEVLNNEAIENDQDPITVITAPRKTIVTREEVKQAVKDAYDDNVIPDFEDNLQPPPNPTSNPDPPIIPDGRKYEQDTEDEITHDRFFGENIERVKNTLFPLKEPEGPTTEEIVEIPVDNTEITPTENVIQPIDNKEEGLENSNVLSNGPGVQESDNIDVKNRSVKRSILDKLKFYTKK